MADIFRVVDFEFGKDAVGDIACMLRSMDLGEASDSVAEISFSKPLVPAFYPGQKCLSRLHLTREQTEQAMQERRREQRTSIDGVFEVVDEYLGETLGKLVDISPKGLRIRSGEPLDVNDELRLRILLPMRILGKSAISATAVCVWSNPDGESDGWLSGFEFYRVSQEACTLILGLILELQKPAETRSV